MGCFWNANTNNDNMCVDIMYDKSTQNSAVPWGRQAPPSELDDKERLQAQVYQTNTQV